MYLESELDVINIIDLEMSCWLDDKKPLTAETDIIEIGLTELNINNGYMARFSYLVYPTNSEISEYCKTLTGITQRDINNYAIPFNDVCTTLLNKHRSKQRIWASYGNDDPFQLHDQCKREGVTYPFGETHLNIKSLVALAKGLEQEVGMVNALNLMNLKLIGKQHNGRDDSYNATRLLWILLEKLQGKNGE